MNEPFRLHDIHSISAIAEIQSSTHAPLLGIEIWLCLVMKGTPTPAQVGKGLCFCEIRFQLPIPKNAHNNSNNNTLLPFWGFDSNKTVPNILHSLASPRVTLCLPANISQWSNGVDHGRPDIEKINPAMIANTCWLGKTDDCHLGCAVHFVLSNICFKDDG